MNSLAWLAGAIAALVAGFFGFNNYMYNEKQADTMTPTTTESAHIESPVHVMPIEHASGIVMWDSEVIYMDPVGGAEKYQGQPAATIVLVTDNHGDHMNADTLKAVLGEATLIAPQIVKDELPVELGAKVKVMKNGEMITEKGITIQAMPMYNLPEDPKAYHVKGRGNGYVLEKDGFRVYIAGDTQGIPEMRALTDIDIAFVPMNLPYTMAVEEAAEAVLEFKPKQVYPYHYRGQGGFSDVEKFKQLVAQDPAIEVVLADWYPNN